MRDKFSSSYPLIFLCNKYNCDDCVLSIMSTVILIAFPYLFVTSKDICYIFKATFEIENENEVI